MKSTLLRKIEDKTAVVGVLGIGYVGLGLALESAKAGYRTIGFDIQQKKVESVNKGCSYIEDIDGNQLNTLVKAELLSASGDFKLIQKLDCVIVCVPTPLNNDCEPDMSRVKSVLLSINQNIHSDMLIIIESTTYPGATEEYIKPILEESGLKCERDFFLAFSPERIDPGNKTYNIRNTPKIVSGIGEKSTHLAKAFYRLLLDAEVYTVSNTRTAEMIKLFENTFRYINIGFVNEMAVLCHDMGIDIWEVIFAAKTKPFGYMPFFPGPGVGGQCIPVSPFYLNWKIKSQGLMCKFINIAEEANSFMPEYIVKRCREIMVRLNRSLEESRILILGATYKPDIADLRESPVLQLMKNLQIHGAKVQYNDPFVRELEIEGKKYSSVNLTCEAISEQDLVIIATPHSVYDYSYIKKQARYIFDIRNGLPASLDDTTNIERL